MSSSQDNDELVDNLMVSGYIRTKKVEQVFRAVDRADYILPSYKENAYKDLAWKHGNIHLSAPCIYSEVMEGLCLEPGLSFLNLGSGTGYLSTMAGLILNQHGTNHGIELHEDCLKYAYERLEEFKQKSLALDEFDFCEPLFIQGNCLSVAPGRQYDRVYCGAACPETHEAFIKQFVRVGGILVMPFKNNLLRVQRINENIWSEHPMLPVFFTTLVVPYAAGQNLVHLPECDPLSLQELCRGKIRHRLRENVWREHDELRTTKAILSRRHRANHPEWTLSQLVVPMFEEPDDALSDDEEFTRRARLLLNVDSPPSTQNENRPNWQDVDSSESSRSNSPFNNSASASAPDNNEIKEESTPDSENLTQCSSNSTRNKSGSQRKRVNSRKARKENSVDETYSSMSDSDSKPEMEETFVQRKKVAEREKTDSGIVEDVILSNEEGSFSSKTNQSDSETVDHSDGAEQMDVDLSDIAVNESFRNMCNCDSPSSDINRNDETTVAHYVDSNAFSTYMKEKIYALPLPFSLKLYINYNRKL